MPALQVMRSQGLTFLIFKTGSKSSAWEGFPSLLFAAPQSLHCASDQFRLSSICKFLLSPPRQLASSFPWCFVNPVVLVHFISFSSTLAWKIPWTEGTGGLQSMGSLGVGHDWMISLSLFTFCIGEGNGNPLQCSCPENPRDGGAWWAAVYGVAQSQTRLKWLSSSSSSCVTLIVVSTKKRCTTWELWVKFYLGRNEDCSPGGGN